MATEHEGLKSWLTRYEYLGSVTITSSDLLAIFCGMFLSMGVAFNWYTYLGNKTKKLILMN